MLLWFILIFSALLSLIVMPGEAAVIRDYTFNETAFDFAAWKESSEGFECPRTHRYKLLCKARWDTINEELEACRGMEGASGFGIMFICLIAIEAIAIGALMLYARRMRKKFKNFDQECKREEIDIPIN